MASMRVRSSKKRLSFSAVAFSDGLFGTGRWLRPSRDGGGLVEFCRLLDWDGALFVV